MRLDHRRLVRAVEPDLVGQVGRAQLLVALAVVAVAGDAILGEDLLAGGASCPRSVGRPDSERT